jgi:serine/threonine-protein kinase
VDILEAKRAFPDYEFIAPLTPSEQKCAFHVKDRNGRSLCLKIVAPNSNIDRVNREIQALQSISHPNVVALLEYTFTSKQGQEQRHYIIEEFVAGDDLTKYLRQGQPLELAHVSSLFAQLADGLTAIHAKNIVHRDLKPSNIRIRDNGSPVLIDFGLARHLDLPDLTKTHEGAAFGTPAYFAPEQFAGNKRDIDARTDLFAMGVLLYQAAVGTHPFYKETMSYAEVRDSVCLSFDYLVNSVFMNLPNDYRLVMLKLLEKPRAKRLQSAAQVGTLLRKIASSGEKQ